MPFVREAHGVAAGGSSPITAVFGVAPANGDVLIAFVTLNSGAAQTVVAPSGWSTVDAMALNASGVQVQMFHKVCGPSEPTSYAFSNAGGALTLIHIVEYSGVDTTTPLDVAASTNTQNATSAPVCTGVSDTTAGSTLVGCVANDIGTNCTASASGVTFRDQTADGTSFTGLDTFEKITDATSSLTLALTGGPGDVATILVRLRPSSAAAAVVSAPARPLLPRLGRYWPKFFPSFAFAVPLPAATPTTPVSTTAAAALEALDGTPTAAAIAPMEAASAVAASSQDPVGAVGGVTATTLEPVEAVQMVARTGVDMVDAVQGLAITGATDPVESTLGVASTLTAQLEAGQALAAALAAPIESPAGVTVAALGQVEAVQGVTATTTSSVVEALNALAATITDPFEAPAGTAAATTNILEALQAVAATGSDPIDAQGNTPVNATTQAVVEALGAVTAPAAGAVEALQALTATRATAVEALAAALTTAGVPVEAAQAIAAAASVLPVETAAAVAITGQLPVEALQIVRAAVLAQLEAVAATPSGAEVPATVTLSARPFATVTLLHRVFAALATASRRSDATVAVSTRLGTILPYGAGAYGAGNYGGRNDVTLTLADRPAADVAVGDRRG